MFHNPTIFHAKISSPAAPIGIIIEMCLISPVDMDLSFCMEENSNCDNSTNGEGSTVDLLVKAWGYSDLLPENLPLFDKVPYQVHLFVGSLLILQCK